MNRWSYTNVFNAMIGMILTILLLTILAATPSILVYATEDQYLTVGHPKNLRFKFPIGRVDVGNPQVANYTADRDKNRITLIPTGPGETRLIVYDTRGTQKDTIKIIVYSKDLKRYIKALRRILKDVEGINISQVESKVVIDGEVFLREDLEKLDRVVKNAPFVINLVTLSRNAQRIIAKKMEKDIAQEGVSVIPFQDKMILKGVVYSKAASENAEKIAQLYWNPQKIVNVLEIRTVEKPPIRAKTIQVSAHFIELNKVYNRNFLFRWVPFPQVQAQATYNFTADTGNSQIIGGLVASFTDLIPRLNYMRSLGIVRVFENPIISVKSGETATLQSGSTLLIPVAGPNQAQTFEPQQIGVTLTITPRQVKEDIDLKVSVNVSSLGSPTASGLINIDTSSIDTQQFVRNGESVVIGGILRTSGTDVRDKQDSGTQEKPGLFTLFKSRDRQLSRAQFIIFVTPKIVDFAREANTELKEYFKLYEVYPSN